MYSIDCLPKSNGKMVILVVVDRLPKYDHFIVMIHPYIAKTIVDILMHEIVILHGIPTSNISDRNPIFVSRFWKDLFHLIGTTLCMIIVNHPQINGQTLSLSRSVETYLRCLILVKSKQWSKCLLCAEY